MSALKFSAEVPFSHIYTASSEDKQAKLVSILSGYLTHLLFFHKLPISLQSERRVNLGVSYKYGFVSVQNFTINLYEVTSLFTVILREEDCIFIIFFLDFYSFENTRVKLGTFNYITIFL